MENLEIIYSEYKRLVDRYDQLLDGSFSDIKLYGVIGPILIGSSTVLESLEIDFFKSAQDLFVFLLSIILLIALIAFRDLIKQSYLQQLGYSIGKTELVLRDAICKSNLNNNCELFVLRKSWLEMYYNITALAYSGFVFIFFIILVVVPLLLLWNRSSCLAIIIGVISLSLLLIHAILSYVIFHKTNKYEA